MQRIAAGRSQSWNKSRAFRPYLVIYLCIATIGSGCRFPRSHESIVDDGQYRKYAGQVGAEIVRQTEQPDTSLPDSDSAAGTAAPRTLATDLPEDDESQYWNLTLQEAIHYGLTNSKVLNDLGGSILRNPDVVPSNMMAAIVQTDPRFGIEGALSAYDARFNVSNKLENNDLPYNNLFLSGGNNGRTFTQQLNTTTTELVKQTATGGYLGVRNVTIYDKNSAPSNLFPSSWSTYYEAEARQSLLQGGGAEFNRIAGALGQPGYYNGVKIARIRADISQAEFEMSIRDYLSNIENAYWDLHFAYRDLMNKVELRDLALEVYGLYKNRVDNQKNEEPYRLAQVREQYYRFQEDVQNALAGRRVDGTRTNNGSSSGTFRGNPGVYLAERRLRLLIGVTTSDSRLIRPTDEASAVETIFGWEMVKAEALSRRPELARQKFQVSKAELELVASRNYLKPRLDLVGKYRIRGFGESMFNGNNVADTNAAASQQFQNANQVLGSGQFQESQFGAEFSMPLGFRQAHAAVAQAEFRVARERAVLHEQERQVVHDVGNAVADVKRSHAIVVSASERREAAAEYLDGLTNKIRMRDFGATHLEQWLEAQRRFAEANTQYHLALCENQIAIKNVNYEKGSLLDYCNIAPIDGTPTTVDPKEMKQPVMPQPQVVPEMTQAGADLEQVPATGSSEAEQAGFNGSEKEEVEEEEKEEAKEAAESK